MMGFQIVIRVTLGRSLIIDSYLLLFRVDRNSMILEDDHYLLITQYTAVCRTALAIQGLVNIHETQVVHFVSCVKGQS